MLRIPKARNLVTILTSTFTSLLALCACLLWLTAGTKLLFAVNTSRSRPDFLVGLGLVAGGLLIGLTTWPLAGQGAFPAEALVIGGVLFWALYGDEANALQPGDCWAPVLTIGAGTLLLHLCFATAGAQPVLDLAVVAFRPFELPALALLGYVWFRRLNRVGNGHSANRNAGFTHLTRTDLRNILWATAAASLASLITGSAGDTLRFLLLSLAPASFLRQAIQANKPEMARIAAVAAVCSVGFIGLERADQVQRQRSWLQVATRDTAAVNSHYMALQRQANQAVETWIYTEPERVYTERHRSLVTNLKQLRKSSTRSGFLGLAQDCKKLDELISTHDKASREVFEAVAMRSAQWGDDQATGRAEARARTALKETRSTHDRGLVLLRSLEKHLAGRLAAFGNDIEALSTTVLSLLLGALLVGLALLTSPLRQEPEVVPDLRTDHGTNPDAAADTDPDSSVEQTTEPEQPKAPGPQEATRQINAELERLAKVMLELSAYCEEEPVAAAAYGCIQVLKDAARGLPNEKLLLTATELERVLKTGGEHNQVTEAAAELSRVCWALGAPENR